jgi:hypothetical protein
MQKTSVNHEAGIAILHDFCRCCKRKLTAQVKGLQAGRKAEFAETIPAGRVSEDY